MIKDLLQSQERSLKKFYKSHTWCQIALFKRFFFSLKSRMQKISFRLSEGSNYSHWWSDAKVLLGFSFLSSLFSFWRQGLLCDPGWPPISYVAHTGLELTILLPQPPKC
jgi:hypothetical protein